MRQFLDGSIGRFEIIYSLGHGGFANVYEVIDPLSPETNMTLKIQRDIEDKKKREIIAEKFKREAWLTKLLDHPGLIKTVESGYIGNRYYMLMEKVNGLDVDDMLKQKKRHSLDYHQSIKIVADLCDVLNYLHNLDIIHGDVKPPNIIYCRQEKATKLIDLGLAFISGFDRGSSEYFWGTTGYFDPESLAKKYYRPTIASDIFALGGTLFELLGGNMFFDYCSHPSDYAEIIWENFANTNSNIEIPADLRDVINVSLSPISQNRFHSAIEFKKALLNILDNSPTSWGNLS